MLQTSLCPCEFSHLCTARSLPLQAGFQRYPLVFDINLDYTNTMNRLQYLVDGHYIDNATASVSLKLITFNGEPVGWIRGAMGSDNDRAGEVEVQSQRLCSCDLPRVAHLGTCVGSCKFSKA